MPPESSYHLNPLLLGLGHGAVLLCTGSSVQLVEEKGRVKGAQASALEQEQSQRDKTGTEAQCCHPNPNAALTICSALLTATSHGLI